MALGDIALNGGSESNHLIVYLPKDSGPGEPERAHTVFFAFLDRLTVCDIYLFGTVSYRVWFTGEKGVSHGPVEIDGDLATVVGIRLEFPPSGPPLKLIGWNKGAPTCQPLWHEIDEL